jgi:hypothetical protein
MQIRDQPALHGSRFSLCTVGWASSPIFEFEVADMQKELPIIKRVLGFWQGATENCEICEALLSEMESRGLTLSKRILFVTMGARGLSRRFKERLGSGLIHQRCTIHMDRNIQRRLAKRWRKERIRGFVRRWSRIVTPMPRGCLRSLSTGRARLTNRRPSRCGMRARRS